MKSFFGSWALPLLLIGSAIPTLAADPAAAAGDRPKTVLGVQGAMFTLNGSPKFLLGFSYYGGLGASEAFIRQDLDDLRGKGFNWLRVWATWDAIGQVVSAVDADGRAREPFISKLKWLVEECDRRGMVVDVTLTRHKAKRSEPVHGFLPDREAHEEAVKTVIQKLKGSRNWYLDLANERDVRDARYVGAAELKHLRELARSLDPKLLVTASWGGHDLSEEDVREAIEIIGVDFLSPHRPRTPASATETEAHTRTCLDIMKKIGRVVPVHYQEPFRRGYERWQPTANDFLVDLRGAIAGGAGGWCFHNGSQRGVDDQQPRRSFDLSQKRLMDQLDVEELKFVEAVGRTKVGQ